jgi:hypothetical protein
MELGKILTISGRTIRPEAQADPKISEAARAALEEFLAQVRDISAEFLAKVSNVSEKFLAQVKNT